MKYKIEMVVARDGDQLLGQFGESQIWYPIKDCEFCEAQGIIHVGAQEYSCEECAGTGFVRDFTLCADDQLPKEMRVG